MGKSTSAQLLGRNHGYVYYEGDCFGGLKNPFNTLDSDNPTMDQIKMRNLKGRFKVFLWFYILIKTNLRKGIIRAGCIYEAVPRYVGSSDGWSGV